MTKRIFDNKI